MSVSYIPADLRRRVVARAEEICAYCLIAEDDTFYGCEADHILSEKHGGRTDAENLAYACVCCNQAKGSDIGSVDPATGRLAPLFNPRSQKWSDHFSVADGVIAPRTGCGRATVSLLRLNEPERVEERRVLALRGPAPSG